MAGGWISAKMCVEEAIISGPSYWREWLSKWGKAYGSVADAQADSIRLWAAFSYHDKAILVLNSYVMDNVFKEEPQKPNMVVVQPGVLDYILLNFPYWTEANRRGEGGVNQALALGSRVISGLFTGLGITVYENKTFRVNNVPYGQFNAFQKVTSVGRYFHVDGDHKVYDRSGSGMYDAKASLSFQHASMDVDSYKEMTPYFMIKKNMRFSEDGMRLSTYMEEFLDNITSVVQASGFEVIDYMVDPYVWHTGASSNGYTQHPNNSGFALIDVWGDMDERYRSVQKDMHHGKEAAKVIRKHLTEAENLAIERVMNLADRLYSPPELNEGVVGFALGVAALNGNVRGNIVATDGSGGPQYLPTVTAQGHLAVGGNLLWAFYLDAGIVGMTVPAPVSSTAPVAYVWAPANAFGVPNAAGVYNAWAGGVGAGGLAANGFFRSTADKVGAAEVGGADAADARADSTNYGVGPPRLVNAPALPYGLSTIGGLFRLARERAWGLNTEIVATALAGTVALEKLWDIVRKLYPDCKLFNAKYTPSFVRSGTNEERDRMYAFLQNVVDHAKLPLWAQRVQSGGQLGAFSGVFMAAPTVVAATNADPLSTDGGVARFFAALGGDFGGLQADPGDADVAATGAKIVRSFLNSDAIEPDVRAAIAADYGAGFANYFQQSTYGRSYEILRRAETQDLRPNQFNNLPAFFRQEVLNRLLRGDREGAYAVLGGLYNHMHVAQSGGMSTVNVNRVLIDRFANFNRSKGKRVQAAAASAFADIGAGRTAAAISAGNGAFTDTGAAPWINTRLSFRPDVFHSLVTRANAGGAPDQVLALLTPVRPGNPENPNEPLAPEMPRLWDAGPAADDLGPYNVDAGAAATYVNQLKHARASSAPGRGSGMGRMIFSYAPAHMAGPRRAYQYGSELRASDLMQIDKGSTGFDVGGSHIPSAARFRPDTLLYEEVQYEDSLGQPLGDVSTFEQRKNLADRINKLSTLEHDPVALWCAILLNFSAVNAHSQYVWLDRGLPIPDSCYTFYQHAIRFTTSSTVWAVSGRDTARIGYNWEDAVIQFQGINKTWHVHYTLWLNAVVINKRGVHIQADTKYEGYVGGMDDQVYDDPSTFDIDNFDFSRSGFIFSHGSECNRAYMMQYCNPMPLWGRHHQKTLGGLKLNSREIWSPKAPLWPSWFFYTFVWQFVSLLSNVELDVSSFKAERENCRGISGEAYHGKMLLQNRLGEYRHEVRGTGFFGNFDPPFKATFDGKIQFPIVVKYEMA